MNSRIIGGTLALLALGVATAPARAQSMDNATAALKASDGTTLGSVALQRAPHGVWLHARLEGLTPGVHAFHVHGVGECTPPFGSAGGHFNPEDAAHGFLSPDGPHAGDLPNIHVPASGALEVEMFSAHLALDERLLDEDGAAIVLHEGADDYETDPAGAAGSRIACGVIEAS